MKKLHILTALLIAALFAGCNSDVLVEESGTIDKGGETARIIKLSTNMPGESNSRVALDEDDNGVNLAWKDGDKIYLIFDDGINKGKQTVVLDEAEDITNEGKSANFEIVVPDEIDGKFTLYGVHGGGGFVDESSDTNYELKLPAPDKSYGESLETISNNNAVMTQFKVENVSIDNPEISVKFEHIGSLFKVRFTNISGSVEPTRGHMIVRLIAQGESDFTVHQPTAASSYDPFTGEIKDTTIPEELLLADGSININVPSGETFESWGWYIPVEEIAWPEVKLNVQSKLQPAVTFTTGNTRPGRSEGIVKGKVYRFYAASNGTNFGFTDKDGIAW